MSNPAIEQAWKAKTATHAAIGRAKTALTAAALAHASKQTIQQLDQALDQAIAADRTALENVAKVTGYNGPIF